VSLLAKEENVFRMLEGIGTEPKVYFRSQRPWVREASGNAQENHRG
jgi:hypothetical protein